MGRHLCIETPPASVMTWSGLRFNVVFDFKRAHDVDRKPHVYCGDCGACWSQAAHSNYASASLEWRPNESEGVSNQRRKNCLLNRLLRRRKKASNLRVIGLWEGNSPVTGEFPAQRASKAESVSIWWRHHVPARNLCSWWGWALHHQVQVTLNCHVLKNKDSHYTVAYFL